MPLGTNASCLTPTASGEKIASSRLSANPSFISLTNSGKEKGKGPGNYGNKTQQTILVFDSLLAGFKFM